MEFRSFFVLIFSLCKIVSTLNQADDLSMGDTVVFLKDKITQMEERMSSFELSLAVQGSQKGCPEDKNEILKKVSAVEMQCADISARLQDAEVRFLKMDTRLLLEVQQAREKSSEAIKRVSIAEQQVASELESKTDILRVKMNETREMLRSFVASHRDTENAIRKNISSSTEKLMDLNNSLSSRFESLTTKMRIFENSMLENKKDYANISFVSKLDESLQHLEKTIKTDIEAIQSELSPRVELLEETCALYQDVAELNKTLRNHTFQITALNTDLLNIQNTCSEPPPIGNGYPLISLRRNRDGLVVTYACHDNMTLVGSGEMVCRSGEWTGDLPECTNSTILQHENCCLSCNTEDFKDYLGLDIPMNTIIQHSKSMDIRCRRGYVIASTSEYLTCVNGTWSINSDPCMKEICDGEPPAVENGKTVYSEGMHDSNFLYECDQSFVMSRNSTVHCQEGKWKGEPPICSFFDATFHLRASTRGDIYIYCYSIYNYRETEFSRVLDTGSGTRVPGKRTYRGYSFIYMPEKRRERFGFFQCGFGDERGSMNMMVQIQDGSGGLYFVDHSKVSNIGDAVHLEVKFDKVKSIRWKHNGVDVPSWNDKGQVDIPSVHPSDAGTYECYYEGQRGVTTSALLRLIVRKCQKNLFGEHCDQQCPPCYNGGICHDHLGVCLCPLGFTGNNCEIACDEDRYGEHCLVGCGKNHCSEQLFCRPDPYGCSCAPGWKGIMCNETCEPGWYGVECKQPCHCAGSHQNCSRWRGTCSGGCSPGWTGQSCQIQVVG